MKILADASLPGLAACFESPFELSLYHDEKELTRLLPGMDALLCRSTLKIRSDLPCSNSLRAIATASSGIDHIDLNFLQKRDIFLADAKGANARSVADYVLASMAWLSSHTSWQGRRAMVIGMGAVGSIVAGELMAQGFEVLGYDPLRPEFSSCLLDEMNRCDLLCIHASLHDNEPWPSRNLINDRTLAQLRPHAAIINASRGGIVNEESILKVNKPLFYCTDVYAHEPGIDAAIVNHATLCTPHIAGHSVEAKIDAVRMVSNKLHQFFGLKPRFSPAVMQPELLSQTLNLKTAASQKAILALYNPGVETVALKQAADKKSAFLSLRRQHTFRHDF